MVLRLPRCIHAIMADSTGQAVVYAPQIQCRMVEAGGKTASGLMTILACIRSRRVRRPLAERFNRIAINMT